MEPAPSGGAAASRLSEQHRRDHFLSSCAVYAISAADICGGDGGVLRNKCVADSHEEREAL